MNNHPVWHLAHRRSITLDRPRLMGIVNVTPDSFSDGGAHNTTQAAVARAHQLIDDGADILDIGGESTRPGAQPVPPQEQIDRVAPVIEQLRRDGPATPISIDTTSAIVARAALDAGADAINDVSGATDDPEMLALAADRDCGLILMHRLRTPAKDSYSDQYDTEPDYQRDIADAVTDALRELGRAALDAGVAAESVVLDAGLGFGKSVAQNYRLIARMGEMQGALGVAMLAGASRKSFLGAASGQTDPARRDPESVIAAIWMLHAGVRLFRVHNVAMHAAALATAWNNPNHPAE